MLDRDYYCRRSRYEKEEGKQHGASHLAGKGKRPTRANPSILELELQVDEGGTLHAW